MTLSRATFRASFPPIMTAIKVTGGREGVRIQLDIPESEMAEAVKLLQWRERVLVVTVEPAEITGDSGDGESKSGRIRY